MNTHRPIWPETYCESPVIPKRFRRGLADFGGKNIYGEPNYIVTWAMDAKIFENGDPHARKYPNPNDMALGWACFWLERYAPPEFFDEKTWAELRFGPSELGDDHRIDFIGPFPRRGGYIGVGPLVKDNEDGEPWEMLPLTTKVLDVIKQELDPGATKSKVNGRLEIGRRVRRAKSSDICQKKLEEVRQYYRTNAEKINAEHTREYTGLKPSAAQAFTGSQITLGVPQSVRQYLDATGAKHTLWEDKSGGNARIDFTI